MDEKPLDMLQVQIDKAMEDLPQATRRAINAVNWREVILGMRERKGFNYEQLEDLELETELLLCGLLKPEQYPLEIERRLGITKAQAELIVTEMNDLAFRKIKDELIKNTERNDLFFRKVEEAKKETAEIAKNTSPLSTSVQTSAPTPVPKPIVPPPPENLPTAPLSDSPKPEEALPEIQSPADKLFASTSMQKTEKTYSLGNLSKTNDQLGQADKIPSLDLKISKSDPYRIDPNE